MVTIGSQIIDTKTNTFHIVDGIEVIDNKTLVFTKDLKCFPIGEIIPIENLYNTQKEVTPSEQYVYSVITRLINSEREMTLGEWAPKHYVPRVKKAKKTLIYQIWENFILNFKKLTSSND